MHVKWKLLAYARKYCLKIIGIEYKLMYFFVSSVAYLFLPIWFCRFATMIISINEIHFIFKLRPAGVFISKNFKQNWSNSNFMYCFSFHSSSLIKLSILMNIYRIIGSKFVDFIKRKEEGPPTHILSFFVVAHFQSLIEVLIERSYLVGCVCECMLHFQIFWNINVKYWNSKCFSMKKTRQRRIHW